MLLPRTIAWIPATALPFLVASQVVINAPVILDGGTPAQRQITGLAAGTDPASALTAGVEQAGTHRAAQPIGPELWSYIIAAAEMPPTAGMHLMLQAPAAGSNEVHIILNGTGPYALTDGPDEPVDASAVPEGTWLSVVYDGSGFQVLNGSWPRRRDCPEGLVAVSDAFCVGATENVAGPLAFFPAIEACAAQGLRLCSWGEWITACQQRDALGLAAMVGNYEWTNDAANEDGRVRMAGGQALPECTGASVGNPGTNRAFRCCYSR